ncbi:hypothetical protein [Polaromonas sp. SM01]|uniref:hypothetical protein n=1 Tax=Polaromonas sp. SM01 TaxID=3085630 RepID=UPI0029812F78|nr:hypothetical protein [Polaromonas sp. SM01]MDW5443802.1 hypothetical protein [Polaromonas sp. SM01]
MAEIPASFPRDPWPAAIPGAQPKLAARLIDGCYIVGMTDEELLERYEMCEDLIQQLLVYCKRKQTEHPEWSREALLQKVEKSARTQGWDISPIEITWLIGRLRERL